MIRFGIIGTNWISDAFIEAGLLNEKFCVNAVYSRTKERASEFAKKYNIKNLFTSLEEMADSKTIDAVYIASPNSFHCSQTLVFLNKKISVLCEKPVGTNEKEVKLMLDTAKKNNTLFVGSMKTLYEPRIQVLKDNLHKIGNLKNVIASRCQYSSRYNNYLNGVVENAFKPELGNGAMMDIGIYLVQPMIHLFGKPKKIYAFANKLSTGVDGSCSVIVDYGDMSVSLCVSKTSNSFSPSEFHGEKGTLFLSHRSSVNPQIKILYTDGNEEIINIKQDNDPMYYLAEDFIKLKLSGEVESEKNKLDDILITTQIIDEYRKQIDLKYPADYI